MNRLGTRARNDSGFTLVELLVAMAVLAVVIPVLVLGVRVVFRSSATAADVTSEAAKRAVLSTYFTTDVASATSVTQAGPACAPLRGATSTATAVVTLTGPAGAVSYVLAPESLKSDGSRTRALVRLDCTRTPARQSAVGGLRPGAVPALECPASAAGDKCRTLRLTVPTSSGTSEVTATRRTS